MNGYGGGSCLKATGEPWRTRMESFRESDQGVKDRRDGQPLNDGLQVGGSALLDSGRSRRGQFHGLLLGFAGHGQDGDAKGEQEKHDASLP